MIELTEEYLRLKISSKEYSDTGEARRAVYRAAVQKNITPEAHAVLMELINETY